MELMHARDMMPRSSVRAFVCRALGDCDKTWALSSDGVKMHDGKSMIMYLHVESAQEECDNGEISTTGKVTDFTGESVHEGCIIQVSVALSLLQFCLYAFSHLSFLSLSLNYQAFSRFMIYFVSCMRL
jgi:hypothetical protein